MPDNFFYSLPAKIRELTIFPCKIFDKYSTHVEEDMEIFELKTQLKDETSLLRKNSQDLKRLSSQIAITLL